MRLIRAMMLAGVVAFSGTALAQEAELKPIDLDFKGGTAAEFVEAIRKVSPETNVAVMPDLTKVTMPPVKLKKVDPGTALDLLAIAPRQQGDRIVTLQVGRFSDPHGELFAVSGEIVEVGRGAASEVTVLSIREVVSDEVDQAGVLTAVEAAVELADAAAPPAVLRFHDATGLLILRGTERQLASASSLIGRLHDQKQQWLQEKTHGSAQVNEQARQVEMLNKALTAAKGRAEQADRRVAEMQMRISVLEETLDRSRHQEEAKDATIRQLTNELEVLRKGARPQ